jgi:hypothetical protein
MIIGLRIEAIYSCGQKVGLWTIDPTGLSSPHMLAKAGGKIKFLGVTPGAQRLQGPGVVFRVAREFIEMVALRDLPTSGQYERSKIATFSWQYTWDSLPKEVLVCFPGIDKTQIQKSADTLLFETRPKSESPWKWRVTSIGTVVE